MWQYHDHRLVHKMDNFLLSSHACSGGMADRMGLCCTYCVPPQVCDRNVENLSGGELQRFAIAVVAAQEANVYMLDEPSSYLDVRQRLKAARVSGLEPGPVVA
jgi:translation initiation factor RLI1